MQETYVDVKEEFTWTELGNILKYLSILKQFPQFDVQNIKNWEKILMELYDYINLPNYSFKGVDDIDFTYSENVRRILAGVRFVNYICSEQRDSKLRREDCEMETGLSHQECLDMVPSLNYSGGNLKLKLNRLKGYEQTYTVDNFLDEDRILFTPELVFILKVIQSRKQKSMQYGIKHGRLENYYRTTFGMRYEHIKKTIVDDLSQQELSIQDFEKIYSIC